MEMEQIDWQNSCRDIKSRGKYLLETEKWSDCRFLVGSETNQQMLAGHKLILAMSSPVFERMFYGNLPDKTDPILIPDVQPDAFRAMMEYIYSDKINITSFDKACELCYVAKKYILPNVVEQCTNFLWSDLSPKNACRAYEFAKLFEEPRLMDRCTQIISTKTREVLADPSFMDIELTTLLMIFDQESLNIESELDLFNALSKYTIDRGFNCTNIASSTSLPSNKKCLNTVTVDVETLTESADAPMEQHVDIDVMQDNSEIVVNSTESSEDGGDLIVAGRSHDDSEGNENVLGEGSSNHNYSAEDCDADERRRLDELLIKEATKKIRFLTMTPQQFAEGPARSKLLSQSEALAIFINISSPSINDCPMPEDFCKLRIRRNNNCLARNDDSLIGVPTYNTRNDNDYTGYSPPVIQHYDLPETWANTTMETRKFYCIRTIRQQIDYRNTSVTDCALTLTVDSNILITGVQVPTQVLCGELMNSAGFTERYSEILYAHLLDAQGSRLTYTHCTSRVRYDSLLEISFDRPVFIHRNKLYKIGVVFNKVGWYPMYTCYPEVTCDNVHFMFNINHESLRDGLIRAIVFTHPITSPAPPSSAGIHAHGYGMHDINN